MGPESDESMESRHRFMRNQLSALGYKYEFSNDALPLLENLVPDLLQTTDTLNHYKELSEGCLQVREFAHLVSSPLCTFQIIYWAGGCVSVFRMVTKLGLS